MSKIRVEAKVSAEEVRLAHRDYMRLYMRHYRSNGRRRCSECGALLKEKKDEGGKEGRWRSWFGFGCLRWRWV
jgi:hypothetical protein